MISLWIFRSLRAVPKLGLMGGLKLFLSGLTQRVYDIRPHGYRHALKVRGGTSDPVLFYQIFCNRGYAVMNIPDVRTVVDAGANVGYFTVFAAHHYPQARVIAIEPEESNYQMLVENTRHLAQVSQIHAGLWSSEGFLRIENLAAEKWAYKCSDRDAGNQPLVNEGLPSVTMQSIQREHQIETFDVVKIDIEGAENEIFSHGDTTWLSHVRVLMCELHPGSWRSFFAALSAQEYDCRLVGENVVVLLGACSKQSGLLKFH